MIIKRITDKNNIVEEPIELDKYVCRYYNNIRMIPNHKAREILIFPCCATAAKTTENLAIGSISYDAIKNSQNLYNDLNTIFMNYKKAYYLRSSCNYFNSIFDTKVNTKNLCLFNSYNDLGLKKIQISTTGTCNLNCIMCRKNIFKEDPELDELYFTMLDKIKGNQLYNIELTAHGEPFYYKKRIFKWLNSLTTNDTHSLFIITNATLLNDDDIYNLYEISKTINIRIQVSFHSIRKETYETVMNCKLYDKVLHNILLLNEYKLLNNVNFVVQPENINDLIDTYKYFYNCNIKFNAIPVNFGMDKNFYSITSHPIYKEFLKILNNSSII